jgi:hypothetical protein
MRSCEADVEGKVLIRRSALRASRCGKNKIGMEVDDEEWIEKGGGCSSMSMAVIPQIDSTP